MKLHLKYIGIRTVSFIISVEKSREKYLATYSVYKVDVVWIGRNWLVLTGL